MIYLYSELDNYNDMEHYFYNSSDKLIYSVLLKGGTYNIYFIYCFDDSDATVDVTTEFSYTLPEELNILEQAADVDIFISRVMSKIDEIIFGNI